MIALLGFRFFLFMELHKIKKRINRLLDRYNGTDDPHTKELILQQLNKERVNLERWKDTHGYG